jgi:hypothetical protein
MKFRYRISHPQNLRFVDITHQAISVHMFQASD